MAINLKPVDVAVVGLGAAGGVAVDVYKRQPQDRLTRVKTPLVTIHADLLLSPHNDR